MKLCNILAILVLISSLAAADKKLNVLFIAVDDMNNDLGCYGQALASTPNIDQLAKQGVLFDRAYCQFPLCSPSRSSVMTGLRPDTTRVFNLRYHFRTELPNVVTLSQMFKNNGYYTARIGKIYHAGNPGDIGTSGLDDEPSWQKVVNPAGIDKTVLEPDIINYTPERVLGSSMALLSDETGSDREHTDGKVATLTIRLIKEHRQTPFFIAMGFYRPHTPFVAPKKYFDLHPLQQITLPPLAPDYQDTVPPLALSSTKPLPYGVKADPAEPEKVEDAARKCKQAYYAAISFVDAQIGRVLDALDQLGLRESTIIVLWSDHGYHLGEHGLWMKQSCFEESARVPLIIAAPGRSGNGQTCFRTVELLDLYPTLAGLAGLVPPENLQGASLVPLLDAPQTTWNRPAFTQVQRKLQRGDVPGHSVRTQRWRYTEWNGGKKGEELYDHDVDPQELENLAGREEFAATVSEMKELLKACHPVPVEGGKAEPAVE